ncbi:MAG: ATPase, T2SS/T4P/T4SS family, partial [Myxococcota bacterium]
QIDVTRQFLSETSFDELPAEYPVSDEVREDFRARVKSAIDEVNPSDVDRDTLEHLLVSEYTGLGALDVYLDDAEVRDIYVNRYDQVLVRRGTQLIQAKHVFSNEDFLGLAARRLLGPDAEMVGADELRFGDGTRAHVVMPPLSPSGPLLTVRKPPKEMSTLDELISGGVLSPGMADFLMLSVDAGRSICIAGPTSSGKTTLLGALAGLIPEGMRIIAIEDYAHIKLDQGSSVRLEASPSSGFNKRFLLRNALSMHPERILLDEARDAEAYDWVTAVAAGTQGSMTTIHGTSAADALGRLENLCLLGSREVNPLGLREQIARAVDLVVVVHRVHGVGLRVQQISEVQGVDLDTFRLHDIFYYRVEAGSGQFHPTGYIPLFYEDLRHAGVDVDFNIFRE